MHVALSLAAAVMGLGLGFFSGTNPGKLRVPALASELARRSFGVDDGMTALGKILGQGLGALSAGFEKAFLSRIPDTLALAYSGASSGLRRIYGGRIQSYAWLMGAAIFILILCLGRELP